MLVVVAVSVKVIVIVENAASVMVPALALQASRVERWRILFDAIGVMLELVPVLLQMAVIDVDVVSVTVLVGVTIMKSVTAAVVVMMPFVELVASAFVVDVVVVV